MKFFIDKNELFYYLTKDELGFVINEKISFIYLNPENTTNDENKNNSDKMDSGERICMINYVFRNPESVVEEKNVIYYGEIDLLRLKDSLPIIIDKDNIKIKILNNKTCNENNEENKTPNYIFLLNSFICLLFTLSFAIFLISCNTKVLLTSIFSFVIGLFCIINICLSLVREKYQSKILNTCILVLSFIIYFLLVAFVLIIIVSVFR